MSFCLGYLEIGACGKQNIYYNQSRIVQRFVLYGFLFLVTNINRFCEFENCMSILRGFKKFTLKIKTESIRVSYFTRNKIVLF